MDTIRTPDINIEHARIIFRNFSGKQSKYNKDGRKEFCLVIDDSAYAQRLRDIGWNVRMLKPRNDDDEPIYYIQVVVSFKVPPKVFLITKKAKLRLDEESIGELDHAEIQNIDLTIRPYCWNVDGETGIKAYLKVMYVTLEEDAFADKYPDTISDDEVPW